MVVGRRIGPFAQRGLDEPLGFAVGFWGVWPGAFVLDLQHSQCLGVAFGSEADAIVRHHPPDFDAVAAEKAQGIEQESQAGFAGLVGENPGTGQARVVVDRQMHPRRFS